MNHIFDLTGKVAVVAGGAGLIGSSLVRGLSSLGAKVYIADLDLERSDALRGSMRGEGFDIETVNLDISNESSVEECLRSIVLKEGRLDVWINNAYPRTSDWGLKLEDIPVDSWRSNVDSHLNGYCLTCRKVAEAMKTLNKGSIINIASIYGVIGPDFSVYEGVSMTMPAAYSAIKGGIINFTRYLASYYGSFGIRVNCVSPGGVFDDQKESFVKNYCSKTPLKRMATPEDIVGPVAFLSSEASSYITGQNLIVDGGWTIV